MLESNWRIILTLGLLIFGLVFAALTREQKQAETRYEAAKSEYEYAKERAPLGALVGGPEPIITDPKAYQDEWRAEQDLFAQRSMALSTEDIVFATWIGIGVTIVGIFFVAKTLEATHIAISEARSTTLAAREANDILREDKRAWLGIEDIEFSDHMQVDERGGTARVSVTVKNYGETPAVEVGFYFFLIPHVENINVESISQNAIREAEKYPFGEEAVFPGKCSTSPSAPVRLDRDTYGRAMKRSPFAEDSSAPFLLTVTIGYNIAGSAERKYTGRCYGVSVFDLEKVERGTCQAFFEGRNISFPDWVT